MVKIINYKKRQTEDGREFFVLEISAGVEIIQSQNTGNFYASLKRTFIPCSFDEPTCIALIGSEIGGSIEKVECEPYQYVNTHSEKPIDTQGMCKWKENSYRFVYEWEKKWNEKSHIRAIDIIEEMYFFQDYYGVRCLSIYDDVFNKWVIKLAELGNDAKEQYDVAGYYYSWKNDCEKAIEWYGKSAKQGYYWAQYSLGRLLFEEEKDLNQAIYWLYQADLQRNEDEIPLEAHPKALKNLTQESWDILLHWYRAFSEKGDYFGQLRLGICYNEGSECVANNFTPKMTET